MLIFVRLFSFLICCSLFACTAVKVSQPIVAGHSFYTATATGKWIIEPDGSFMADPQTSGLANSDGYLFAVSDASAKQHQIRVLHKLSIDTGEILEKIGPVQLSRNIAENSCFANYLNDRPDYEGIVSLPDSKTEWLMVTEDASRGDKISPACLAKFEGANFTHYPSLLVKIELVNDMLILTGVRVLKFNALDIDKRLSGSRSIENDGIEGVAITRNGKILLGLEKDALEKPRVFELSFAQTLFDTVDEFIEVQDSGLLFPDFMTYKNPINGMDVYYPNEKSGGFLITAARNANQLWILDLEKKRPAIIVDLNLYAPSDTTKGCAEIHKIRNTAIEGVTVREQTIYLVNDPWKAVYPKNIICAQDKDKYEGYSPLLFNIPIEATWFE